MSNIIDKLNEVSGQESHNLRYYGKDDMGTYYNMGSFINHFEEINKYFSKDLSDLNNVDDFVDFMWLNELINYEQIRDEIKTEKQSVFDSVLKLAKERCSKYLSKDIITFINI
jgi:hypothetical protein